MAKRSLQEQYDQQIGDLERSAFIEVVRQNPGSTLREIVELVGRDHKPSGLDLMDVTVAEISGKITSVRNVRRSQKKGATTKAKRGAGRIDTRTQVGRNKFDQAVHDHLKKNKSRRWASSELRKLTGATEHQLRASLGRLIESGLASWEGSTNQTRYFVA